MSTFEGFGAVKPYFSKLTEERLFKKMFFVFSILQQLFTYSQLLFLDLVRFVHQLLC